MVKWTLPQYSCWCCFLDERVYCYNDWQNDQHAIKHKIVRKAHCWSRQTNVQQVYSNRQTKSSLTGYDEVMFAPCPDIRSKVWSLKLNLNQPNNTKQHNITVNFKTVFNEYYVATTAPAMWLSVSSCRYVCQNNQHSKWNDSAAGTQ